jgi:hypothetical protein
MAGDARIVSISEAARIVSDVERREITRSTLSRYVTQWASALDPKREGRETLVDIDRLLAHRADNIRIERADAAPYASARTISDGKQRKTDAEARSAEVKAITDEMQLQRDRGELVERSEVVAAAHEALAAMEAALDLAEASAITEIARRTRADERTVRAPVKALRNEALRIFRETLSASLPSPEVDGSARR